MNTATLETPTTPVAPAQQTATPADTPPEAAPNGEAKPEGQQDEGRFSSRFAALSKREQKLQLEREELKREREQVAKEREETAAIRRENEEMKAARAKAKEDPVAFMKAHDLTYKEVTDFILKGPKSLDPADVDRIVEEKLTAAEKKRAEEDAKRRQEEEKQALERENETIQKEFDAYAKQTMDFINANPDDYELLLVNNAEDQVFSVIAECFKATGEVLEPKVAADLVEEYLFEQSQKLLKTKKLAPTTSPAPQGALRDKSPDVRDQAKPSPTLTNSAAVPPAQPSRPLTDEERYERAIARLNGR